jgi:hypothetical protein
MRACRRANFVADHASEPLCGPQWFPAGKDFGFDCVKIRTKSGAKAE